MGVLMRRRAQSTIEYAAWMAVVAAMLMAMSIYTVRALCGRWRQVGDTFGYGRQFEPGNTVVTNQ